MPAIITNARGVRAAWEEGLLDALLLAAFTVGGGAVISAADRVLITVKALKMWPDHDVVTMTDRVLMVEDSAAIAPDHALRLLSARDHDKLLVDALFRPVLYASCLRPFSPAETSRLAQAVRAAGVEPRIFGLPE